VLCVTVSRFTPQLRQQQRQFDDEDDAAEVQVMIVPSASPADSPSRRISAQRQLYHQRPQLPQQQQQQQRRLSHMPPEVRLPSPSRAMMSMSAPGGRVHSSAGRVQQQRPLQRQQHRGQDEEEGEW
jgi:hypothetical protein